MSANETLYQNEVRAELAQSIDDHWVLYLIEGVVLLALGLIAITVPPIGTLGVTVVIGWVFLGSGMIGWITSCQALHAPGFSWSLISALWGIAAGLVLLGRPGSGTVSLAHFLIAFFVIEAIASIVVGFGRRRHVSMWGGMVARGATDLLLAAILFAGLPVTAAWSLGLLLGIDMVFGGAALAVIGIRALTERRLRCPTPAPSLLPEII